MERRVSLQSSHERIAQTEARRRRRGILAFLPDSIEVFSYDADCWRKKGHMPAIAGASTKRQRRRHRQMAKQSVDAGGEKYSRSCNTDETLQDSSAVVIFLMDPHQVSSLRLLRRLIERLVLSENQIEGSASDDSMKEAVARSHQRVHGIVVLSAPRRHGAVQELLRHSGLSLLAMTEAPLLKTVLQWTACPALSVLDASTGRNMSSAAEEMALEWHPFNCQQLGENVSTDAVLNAWQQGQSALTSKQKVRAALTVPSAMPCSVL